MTAALRAILQFGKRLAFVAVDGGELLAFSVKIFPPDSLRLLQGLAALARCLLTLAREGSLLACCTFRRRACRS